MKTIIMNKITFTEQEKTNLLAEAEINFPSSNFDKLFNSTLFCVEIRKKNQKKIDGCFYFKNNKTKFIKV